MSDRRDIQALRGVAILAVLAGHLLVGDGLLQGGFRGVDIFFVISGFVITLSIRRRSSLGAQGALLFLTQRLRRLYPALWTVMFVTMIVVALTEWFPYMEAQVDHAALSGAWYVENLWLFAREFGYFEPDFANPFTHLWSLAVEEQFYLGAAVVLAILPVTVRRWSRLVVSLLPAVVVVVMLLSLGLSLTIGERELFFWRGGGRDWSAFYLPHLRIWQILLGVLVAEETTRRASRNRRSSRQRAAALFAPGSLMICVALVGSEPRGDLNSADHRVRWLAICATVGTALVISAGDGQRFSVHSGPLGRTLASIGDRSYSLYLVHWPITALLPSFQSSGAWRWLSQVSLTVVLSEILHRSVEWRWVRQNLSTSATWRRVLVGQAALTIVILLWGVQLDAESALDRGRPVQASTSEACGDFTLPFSCFVDLGSDVTIFLEGDSHALMVAPVVLEEALRNNLNVAFAIDMAGLPYELYNQPLIDYYDSVVISWFKYHESIDLYTTHLRDRSSHDRVREVVVVLDTPKVEGWRPMTLSPAAVRGNRVGDAELMSLAETEQKISVVDAVDWYCDSTCPMTAGATNYFVDNDHLSSSGAERVRPMFAMLFDQIRERHG